MSGPVHSRPPVNFCFSQQGIRISSHSGNTDVTVLKSPPCIVCGGKPKLPGSPLADLVLLFDGAGWP